MMDCRAAGKLIEWAAEKSNDEKTKSMLFDEMHAMSKQIAGPNPSPIERVLAETPPTCCFAFRLHEAHYSSAITGDGSALAQSEHAQRRMDRAHRRFPTTVKRPATVRRIAVPSLQMNGARQQVNQLNAGGAA
jgi:hypothetical protein